MSNRITSPHTGDLGRGHGPEWWGAPPPNQNMDDRRRQPNRDNSPSTERRKKSPCGHRAEPDPAEIAQRLGAETTVPIGSIRLVCSQCGSRNIDMVVIRTERR
jgi:hypothetical protein